MTALPTLEELGVATMDPESLAELAQRLKTMASYVEEIRYLRLERQHHIAVAIPNRPALGYYIQLQNKRPA
jgi:hypothetical protein